ncbi:cupin domain-containing protein [Candidimonas humi]|uniref:Cupin domain-containing protein n=1 Tax=Candidimonas humi TaxID=683355 RepID=A0ABV8NYB3_9BURK|nr:cupin domain-containing protein [Candidimonas humi]MBV6304682.1 cupin domain-containing protein [Candidimonas humi]
MADLQMVPDEAARRSLNEDLARYGCRVYQPDDPPLFTRSPRFVMQPQHWRWSDIGPLLDRLGQQLSLEKGGQRRTLRLCNPGLPYGTTPTFWASIQVILPGEIATAHRHTASALRYIMQGSGAMTTVNGERYPMNERDLVLTPAMAWHDHEHHGDKPMIWLDVLDISLVRSMHATFFEESKQATQDVADIPDRSFRQFGSGLMSPPDAPETAPRLNPLLAYPRELAFAALAQAAGLDPDPFDDVVLEYRNPTNGAAAMQTLGLRLQMLRPGMRGKARRHTGSKLYYVVEGQGTSIVEGRACDWSTGDFLAIPPWAWHEHANRSSTHDAVLFQVNDIPAMRALGLYAEQALSSGQGHQEVIGQGFETGTNR